MANPQGINQYTRSQGHADLHKAIKKGVKGVNASLTIAAYRSTAAKAIVNNRKVMKHHGVKMDPGMHYKLATATVEMRKAQFAQASKKLHPMYR